MTLKIPAMFFATVVFAVAARDVPAMTGVPAPGAVCAAGAPLVAVLDTGVDPTAFPDRLWINPGETGPDARGRDRATNGIDDDGNGFIDDVHGWNFLEGTADIGDRDGHGTHIAGLISVPPARLMILKYAGPAIRAGARGTAFVSALRYAVKMGADVIHVSGGGDRRNRDEERVLREAARRGVLVIAASGNKRPGAPDRPFFPAAYPLSNIVPVGATDEDGRVLPTTNLVPGKRVLLERGRGVLSRLPGGRRGEMTGSSQAAAIHTGKLLSRVSATCDANIFKRASTHLRSSK